MRLLDNYLENRIARRFGGVFIILFITSVTYFILEKFFFKKDLPHWEISHCVSETSICENDNLNIYGIIINHSNKTRKCKIRWEPDFLNLSQDVSQEVTVQARSDEEFYMTIKRAFSGKPGKQSHTVTTNNFLDEVNKSDNKKALRTTVKKKDTCKDSDTKAVPLNWLKQNETGILAYKLNNQILKIPIKKEDTSSYKIPKNAVLISQDKVLDPKKMNIEIYQKQLGNQYRRLLNDYK